MHRFFERYEISGNKYVIEKNTRLVGISSPYYGFSTCEEVDFAIVVSNGGGRCITTMLPENNRYYEYKLENFNSFDVYCKRPKEIKVKLMAKKFDRLSSSQHMYQLENVDNFVVDEHLSLYGHQFFEMKKLDFAIYFVNGVRYIIPLHPECEWYDYYTLRISKIEIGERLYPYYEFPEVLTLEPITRERIR